MAEFCAPEDVLLMNEILAPLVREFGDYARFRISLEGERGEIMVDAIWMGKVFSAYGWPADENSDEPAWYARTTGNSEAEIKEGMRESPADVVREMLREYALAYISETAGFNALLEGVKLVPVPDENLTLASLNAKLAMMDRTYRRTLAQIVALEEPEHIKRQAAHIDFLMFDSLISGVEKIGQLLGDHVEELDEILSARVSGEDDA